jgi:head-tail adaptor
MRQTVRIEQRSKSQDAAGEPLDSWTLFAERRAAIQRAPGKELWASGERQGRVPTVFRLRYLDGVLPEMRLLLKKPKGEWALYDIVSATDPDGRREELIVTCTEWVGAKP